MLAPGEKSPGCIAIDAGAGVAYVGTANLPGWIIKIRLSDFARLGILQLNADEGYVGVGALDPQGGYGYFMAADSNSVFGTSKIVRVRLADFSRVDALKLDTYEYGGQPMLVDHANDVMYVAVAGVPDRVMKVRLSDFTRLDALTAAANEQRFQSAAIDPAAGLAFFGAYFPLGPRIVSLDLKTFTRQASYLYPEACYTLHAGALYFGSHDGRCARPCAPGSATSLSR